MFYIRLTVSRKKKPSLGIQKIKRREPKHTTMENHELTKERSKRGRKDKGNTIASKLLIRWHY